MLVARMVLLTPRRARGPPMNYGEKSTAAKRCLFTPPLTGVLRSFNDGLAASIAAGPETRTPARNLTCAAD